MKKHSKLKKFLIIIGATLGILLVLALAIYVNLKSFTVKKVQITEGVAYEPTEVVHLTL